MNWKVGDIGYPWGNRYRAQIIEIKQTHTRARVQIRETVEAQFSGHRMLIYNAGDQIEIDLMHLHRRPRDRGW